jgi:hypothetical protein
VHFQIKGRERRGVYLGESIHREILDRGASEGEIEGGTIFGGREFGVEEEETM